MKKLYILLFFIPLLVSAQQHVQFDLVSRMNGTYVLENGQFSQYWGYGYANENKITLPAPLLEVTQHDTVSINFTNDSPETHTIHLHGLDVDQANDGVPTTSFQVLPNNSTTYTFVADHSGTFLYHCHVLTTLHLSMGMYGMLVVNPTQQGVVYDNGPAFDQEYRYLFSEMNSSWNINPLSPGPFHLYEADVFLNNGYYESSIINTNNQHVTAGVNEKILLRLGSVCYSKTEVIFPSNFDVDILMSDGRVLPNNFSNDTLEIYPGERYSLLISSSTPYIGPLPINYIDSREEIVMGTNQIPVNISTSDIESHNLDFLSFTNHPFQSDLTFRSPVDINDGKIYSINGQLIQNVKIKAGDNDIQFDGDSGMYIIRSESYGIKQKFIVVD